VFLRLFLFAIEILIDELIETIGKIRQNRETNASAVKEQKILVEKRISHIPQVDGELDMMLISCNILLVLK
jgi:hypothetical protein